jgi:hypothetical protein
MATAAGRVFAFIGISSKSFACRENWPTQPQRRAGAHPLAVRII